MSLLAWKIFSKHLKSAGGRRGQSCCPMGPLCTPPFAMEVTCASSACRPKTPEVPVGPDIWLSSSGKTKNCISALWNVFWTVSKTLWFSDFRSNLSDHYFCGVAHLPRYLQLDSHMRFVASWDLKARQQLRSCRERSEKPILCSYGNWLMEW
jgi:hypothetical protein